MIYPATDQYIDLARTALENGEVIVYPTDTLYGFGVDATNTEAIQRLNRLKGRAKPLSIVLESVDHMHDFAEFDVEIESEINQLNHQLKSGRNIHGRKREFSTDSEKCRQRVLRNYKTALKNIDKHLPELANYLKDQIVTGSSYIYKHEDSTEWTLS